MLLSLVFACAPSAPAPSNPPPTARHLTLAGSSTIQPVAEIAGKAFEQAHPGARVDVQGGGSSVGISSARSGLSDIGTVSRALKPEESDLTATTIGLDGIAIIVHATNPLDAVTRAQVASIYDGSATRWAALGGADHTITVVNKEEGRSTRELFENHFGLKDRFVASAIVIGPNGQAITTVAGNPYAIAYVSIGSATFARAEGAPVKLLALDGVGATVAHVADKTYPLMRPLNLVTKGPPAGLARDFVDFLISPEGQALVAKEDFVPVAGATASL